MTSGLETAKDVMFLSMDFNMSNIELNPPGQIFRCSVFETGFTPSLVEICIYIYTFCVIIAAISNKEEQMGHRLCKPAGSTIIIHGAIHGSS